MSSPIKILTFAGSARKDSLNKKLARLGAKLCREAGVEAQFIDLLDYNLPLYDGDYEMNNPYPENATSLKQHFDHCQGFLIASPEYNSSVSALLKNTIDWLSRSSDGGGDLSVFAGKVVALVSTSPGQLGGLRGLNHIRQIMSNIGCFVIPNQLAVGQGLNAFTNDNQLINEHISDHFNQVIKSLIETTSRMNLELDKL
tara:strand:- start:18759 stop:19355 length:597 start_codon:yes stop_codon:yes gene_type:complete